MKNFLKILILIFLYLAKNFGGEVNNMSIINEFLVNQYAQKYQVNKEDITLEINHLPEIAITNQQLQLVDKSNKLQLGHNRATLQLIRNNTVQNECQISYKSKIEIMTPVLKKMIKFGESVTSSDLKLEKREIKYNYDEYYRSSEIEDGMIAKSLLHKGDILKRSDIRTKPVIIRGQEVELRIKSGSILIEMNGIAKEEGQQGEKIRVYNQTTRKHYFGIVESPQIVVINLE